MKKYILLLIVPFLSFGQTISIAPQISFQTDSLLFNYKIDSDLESLMLFLGEDGENILKRPIVLYGLNISSQLSDNIMVSLEGNYGQISNTWTRFHPASDGVAVPSATAPGGFEIIGAHDEYTTERDVSIENIIINGNISIVLNSMLNLADLFHCSLDLGVYAKKNSFEMSGSFWDSLTNYEVVGGNIIAVEVEGLNYFISSWDFWDMGINLGCSFGVANVNLNPRFFIPIMTEEQNFYDVRTGSQEITGTLPSNLPKPSFLLTVSYVFNLI
jgi:hypothetical protein